MEILIESNEGRFTFETWRDKVYVWQGYGPERDAITIPEAMIGEFVEALTKMRDHMAADGMEVVK